MDPKRPVRQPADETHRDGENPATPPYRDEVGKGKANDGRDEQGNDFTESDDPGHDPTKPADAELDRERKERDRRG